MKGTLSSESLFPWGALTLLLFLCDFPLYDGTGTQVSLLLPAQQPWYTCLRPLQRSQGLVMLLLPTSRGPESQIRLVRLWAVSEPCFPGV